MVTKQFYKLLLTTKAKLPNMSKRLIADFGVEDMLDKIYLLPHFVAIETYIWSLQYRLLNYILFTNVKLLKIGFALTDKCTFVIHMKRLFITCSLSAPTCKLFGNACELVGRRRR